MAAKSLVLILLLFSPAVNAQMWGTGMYGGMQACAYPQQVASGAVSEDDSVREAREALSELQAQLKTKKSEKKKVERQTDKARQDIERGISDDYTGFVLEHIENSRSCASYKGFQGTEESQVSAEEGSVTVPQANMTPIQSFSVEEWRAYCDRSKSGSVNGALCADARFQKREGRANASACKKALVEYRKNYSLQDKLQGDIEDLEARIKDAKEELTDARKQAAEDRKTNTEGGVCLECLARSNGNSVVQPQTNWASVLGNVGVGLASIYIGYKTNKMIADNNANLGWPTDPYAAQGYGYGLGAIATGMGQVIGGGSGIYGSMAGGMGAGAFGCAGNNGGPYGMMGPYGGMNGSGMWGNPYAMNSMGGGLFNGGMGPWGMNSYNPMMNMMGMNGYNPMLANGMMGGMLGTGNMLGYGNMMSYGSMLGGSLMGGSMMGSYNLQYQQQLMQLQMQQYQSQMQKYSTLSSLQQEMYNLMFRMQQIQYGGSYLGTSLSGLGTGTSTYLTPLPGSTSTLTTLPGSLSTSGR